VAVLSLAVASAVLLPANLLANQRFHHDEALYTTWALQITSGADPWLAHTPVDKPPLFLYILAGAMRLLGPTETAARIPSLLATALSVLLTFWLGRKLYGEAIGLVAAWLMALSPFTLLFAPTAFTDPLLVALVLAACVAAAHHRPVLAGMMTGLAIATKQQGVFFTPVVLTLLIYDLRFTIYDLRLTHHASRITYHVSRFTLGLLFTLLPVFIWDFTRNEVPDFLTYSLSNYGGLSGDAASFGERWGGFFELLQYGTASRLLNGIFGVGLPVLLAYGVWSGNVTADRRPPTAENSLPCTHTPLHPCIATKSDWIFTTFTLFFLLGHALFSFQVWDRYLLGLTPFLALLLARILWLPGSILTRMVENRMNFYHRDAEAQRFLKFNFLCVSGPLWLNSWQNLFTPVYGLALALLLAVTLARPVQDAVNGRYPLGSHSQALGGIEQMVAYLQGHAGANHTLYHRWLGTHWRFYLWGYPYDLQYWASPQELAAKAKPGHLIAFPSWQSETEARLALAGVGLELKELTRAYNPAGYPSVILYEIVSSQ
jgi:4-amino-4-deoxy-L-arabinose transferase-like glycosyltransferase